MPYKDKFLKRDYSREYMRNWRASKKGLTVKLVKPNLVKPNLLNPVNPRVVKPCSTCPTLKKKLENLEQQIQNLSSENQQILVAKKTLQKQLFELENKPVKKEPKIPKKVAVRQSQDQPIKVDLAELEKETGLTKDWKNPAWNRAWKIKYNELYNQLPSTLEKKRQWARENGGR